MDFGVYAHIPYCRVQCPYCTFYTVLKSHAATESMRRFMASVQREWQLRVTPRLAAGDRLRTLYLGGGTPSDLPLAVLTGFLAGVIAEVPGGVAALEELTIECNPESITPASADALLELGVGRISLGVQALDDTDLERLGRASRVGTVRAAVRIVAARWNNWNADLILGIPGSNGARLSHALEELEDAGAPHLSFYCLEMPPRQAQRFGDPPGELGDAFKADLYAQASRWASDHGFEHYEVSNAARPGFRALHNSAYWGGREYVGLGPGAHSFAAGARRANRADLTQYVDALEQGGEPPASVERLTAEARWREIVMLGLRQRQGLDLTTSGVAPPAEWLDRLCRDGLGFLDGPRLCLTPRGWLVMDSIVLQLVAPHGAGLTPRQERR